MAPPSDIMIYTVPFAKLGTSESAFAIPQVIAICDLVDCRPILKTNRDAQKLTEIMGITISLTG